MSTLSVDSEKFIRINGDNFKVLKDARIESNCTKIFIQQVASGFELEHHYSQSNSNSPSTATFLVKDLPQEKQEKVHKLHVTRLRTDLNVIITDNKLYHLSEKMKRWQVVSGIIRMILGSSIAAGLMLQEIHNNIQPGPLRSAFSSYASWSFLIAIASIIPSFYFNKKYTTSFAEMSCRIVSMLDFARDQIPGTTIDFSDNKPNIIQKA